MAGTMPDWILIPIMKLLLIVLFIHMAGTMPDWILIPIMKLLLIVLFYIRLENKKLNLSFLIVFYYPLLKIYCGF